MSIEPQFGRVIGQIRVKSFSQTAFSCARGNDRAKNTIPAALARKGQTLGEKQKKVSENAELLGSA